MKTFKLFQNDMEYNKYFQNFKVTQYRYHDDYTY